MRTETSMFVSYVNIQPDRHPRDRFRGSSCMSTGPRSWLGSDPVIEGKTPVDAMKERGLLPLQRRLPAW